MAFGNLNSSHVRVFPQDCPDLCWRSSSVLCWPPVACHAQVCFGGTVVSTFSYGQGWRGYFRIMKDKAAAEGMMTLPREYKLAPVEAEVCSAVVNLDADIFLERIEELRNLYKPFLPYPDALEEQHMMSMEHHPHMEEHHHQHGHMQEVMHPPGGHHDPHHDPHGMLQHHHQQHPGHPHHDEGQVPHPHAHHMEHQIHHHPEHHHEQEMHHHHHHHHEHHPHPEAGMMVQEGEEAKEESKYSAAEVQYLRDIAETLVRRVGDSICLMLHEDMSFTSPLKVILWRSFKDGPSGSVTQRKLSQNSGPVSINDYNEKVPVASEAAMTVRILSLMAKRGKGYLRWPYWTCVTKLHDLFFFQRLISPHVCDTQQHL